MNTFKVHHDLTVNATMNPSDSFRCPLQTAVPLINIYTTAFTDITA